MADMDRVEIVDAGSESGLVYSRISRIIAFGHWKS